MSDIAAGMLLFLALVGGAVFSFRLVTILVRLQRISASWEVRILATALLFCSLLVLLVEALSLLKLLSAFGLAAAWLIASVLLHSSRQQLDQHLPPDASPAPSLLPPTADRWGAEERLLRHGIVWTLALAFGIGFFVAPIATDPLNRDLARILHWLQNSSVAPYPAHDISVQRSGPFPACALLHLFLLGDSDQLVKLASWTALVLALTTISGLTGLFRANSSALYPKAKLWSAAAALALLLGLHLAFPSPAFFFCGLWLAAITLCGMLLIRAPGNFVYALLLGSSVALALLTDQPVGLILGTVFLFVAMTRGGGRRIRVLLAALIPVVLLNLPHFLRTSQIGRPSLLANAPAQLALLLLILLPCLGRTVALRLANPAKITLAGALATVALASLLFDPAQPILTGGDFLVQSRERQRFHGAAQSYPPAAQAASDLVFSGVTNIALHITGAADPLSEIDYPFRAMLHGRGFDGEIHYLGATNQTTPRSASVAPQALLSSAAEITNLAVRLPYKLSYGPFATYWSELDSRWVQLLQQQPDNIYRIFSPAEQELIQFHNRSALLFCRVARQGVLTLEGGFGDRQGLLKSPTALSVNSRAGFVITSRSTNALHTIEVPLPPGETEIQLSPAFDLPSEGVFALRSWSWYPTEQPLPFISISRIQSSSLEPNTLLLAPGSDLTIELISGAVGIIDLQIYATGLDATPIVIANDHLRTNVAFRTGAAIARLPIARGTNQFILSTPSTNAFLLDRVAPRFRDFVE